MHHRGRSSNSLGLFSFPFLSFFFQVKFPSSGKKLGYETPLEARQTFAVLKRGHGDAFPPPPIYRGKRVARVLVLGDELGNTCGQVCSRVYTNFPLYIYVAWWPKCFVNVAKEKKKKKQRKKMRHRRKFPVFVTMAMFKGSTQDPSNSPRFQCLHA